MRNVFTSAPPVVLLGEERREEGQWNVKLISSEDPIQKILFYLPELDRNRHEIFGFIVFIIYKVNIYEYSFFLC